MLPPMHLHSLSLAASPFPISMGQSSSAAGMPLRQLYPTARPALILWGIGDPPGGPWRKDLFWGFLAAGVGGSADPRKWDSDNMQDWKIHAVSSKSSVWMALLPPRPRASPQFLIQSLTHSPATKDTTLSVLKKPHVCISFPWSVL